MTHYYVHHGQPTSAIPRYLKVKSDWSHARCTYYSFPCYPIIKLWVYPMRSLSGFILYFDLTIFDFPIIDHVSATPVFLNDFTGFCRDITWIITSVSRPWGLVSLPHSGTESLERCLKQRQPLRVDHQNRSCHLLVYREVEVMTFFQPMMFYILSSQNRNYFLQLLIKSVKLINLSLVWRNLYKIDISLILVSCLYFHLEVYYFSHCLPANRLISCARCSTSFILSQFVVTSKTVVTRACYAPNECGSFNVH